VLIRGESGVGKELVSRAIHQRSTRRNRPFVKVNCAALPAELLESELFGHERGAFTGAQAPRIGKFEFANGGTLMLDEIGEMPIALQAKLLQVLQDGEITKLGSNRAVTVRARVVAATNRDLHAMIQAGQFRADLFYRLQVIEIRVPPLRDRREEIPALIDFFLRRYSNQYGRPVLKPSASAYQIMVNHDWPGNIRELENRIKRFVILRDESALIDFRADRPQTPVAIPAPAPVAAPPAPAPNGHAAAAPVAVAERPNHADHQAMPEPPSAPEKPGRLPDVARAAAMVAERRAIQDALDRVRWNRTKAAQMLGVSYKTLLSKMKECGISAPAGAEEI